MNLEFVKCVLYLASIAGALLYIAKSMIDADSDDDDSDNQPPPDACPA